jgi:nitrite reductase (NO-forming)
MIRSELVQKLCSDFPDLTQREVESVVGAIFDRVYMDGSLAHPLEGVQTVTVPVGGGAIFEARLVEAGTYPFVSHAFADATKGAVGMFAAH